MTPRRLEFIIFVLLLTAGHARAQKWFTADVARELGHATCGKCPPPHYKEKVFSIGASKVSTIATAAFDTIATYAQGRVVDIRTHQPIKGAIVRVRYTCGEGCKVKEAATNKAGFFRLGWVGCHGPKGSRSNRPLLVQATGFRPISTEAVGFGALAYLHIQLVALPKRR